MAETSTDAAAPAERRTTITRATLKARNWSWMVPDIASSF